MKLLIILETKLVIKLVKLLLNLKTAFNRKNHLSIKIPLLLLIFSTSSYAELDLEVGYTVPTLSEINNAVSYEGNYIKGGYRFDNGWGIIGEYNDLSLGLESYNWFIGTSKKWYINGTEMNMQATVNEDRYKFDLESYAIIYKDFGMHGGFSHSQKYKGHGRLTDVIIGGYYRATGKINLGIDYKVGNAPGNKGANIQDRVNLYLRFADWY